MRSESPNHLSHGQSGKWNVEGVLMDLPAEPAPLDLAGIFGNRRPVELEVGTGKGTFLLERATARPELNFIGIEYARQYCLYSADRFRRAALTNVRMFCTDAGEFVRRRLANQSLLRVHVYFPDPWPKKRHHRRRLIQTLFVPHLRRVLTPGGELLIVTDHMGYFRHIQAVMSSAEGFAKVPFPQMRDAEGEIVGTNFERKYIAQGRPFYNLARMKYH